MEFQFINKKKQLSYDCDILSKNTVEKISKLFCLWGSRLPKYTKSRKTQTKMDTILNGHNSKWTQFQMDTIPNGHNPNWTQSRLDTIPNRHDPE